MSSLWRQTCCNQRSNVHLNFSSVRYVLVIAWCWVQYGIYFSSSFCFRHIARAEGECNIGNKMNEKNISHIARNCHAITGLSLGELNHRRSCTSQWTIWRSDIHSYLTSCRKHGIETNQTDNLKNHRSQTPFSSAKTDVLHQNFALHLESNIALQKYRKLHSVARIWDICTPY